VTFVAYTSSIISKYYVNIVTPTPEVNNIEFDGTIVGGFTTFTGDQRYSYLQLAINQGNHRLRNLNSTGGFVAYVYGFGGNEAYGYGVGFNLNLVLDLSENNGLSGDTVAICKGTSVKLSADPYFDNYVWNTKDSTQDITVEKSGWYSVTGTTIDGCERKDSVYGFLRDPAIYIGADKSGCSPFSVQLDGGAGFTKYVWNTGETTRKITANTSGQYIVNSYDRWGCPAKDTMQLTVYPVPVVSVAGDTLLCGSQTGTVKVNFSGTDDSIWKGGTSQWDTGQPGKLSLSGQALASADFTVNAWGKYDIRYALTTVNKCLSKDTLQMGIFQKPTSDFTFIENPNDKCAGYSREILYTGNATSKAGFYWDFGGSKLVETIDWRRSRVSLGANNKNPFISLVVGENGCRSDTTRKAIGANPDFSMNTVKSRGCDSATIYFSGTLKVPDALKFEWDFGDVSAISNLQNPSHFYGKQGSYNVSLLITNVLTGCKTGFTIDDMVRIFNTPVAKISANPAICYDDTIPVFYTLAVDSSFSNWQFDGARKFGNGNNSIRVILDKPVVKISLQVNEYGCLSKWAETTVKRNPNFDFMADTLQNCQPMSVKVEAITKDGLLEYTWLTDTLKVIGSEKSLFLPKPGKVTVSLAAFSTETGCRDTVTKTGWILVHPKPLAAFEVDYQAAILGQSDLTFTNKTTLAENFNWDFGDGSVSTDKDPRHNFTKLGKYPVTLFVASEFGCKDTAEMDIEILPFDIATPNAFRPDSYIDKNRVFMPFTIGVNPEKFHIRIFNRWGQVVFESKSLEYPWDGTLKNGIKAPMGNYVWLAEYYDIQGFRHQRKGQVLLIR
jgi:PKD repeat protein